MIQLEIQHKIYECPNQYSEITLGQLQEIVNLFQNTNKYQSWIDVISRLTNLDQQNIEKWAASDFAKITRHVLPVSQLTEFEGSSTVYVDEVAYTYADENLTGQMVALLHQAYQQQDNLSQLAAVLWQPQQRNYTPEYLHNIAQEFQLLPADKFIPGLVNVTGLLALQLQQITTDNAITTDH